MPPPPPAAESRAAAEGPARVLAVYAHPDDPEVSCGGTLARWARAGAEVHVVVCAAGDKGAVDPAVDPAELTARRAQEAAAAAAALGLARTHLLARPDGEVDNDAALRRELVAHIRAVKPDALVTHDPTAVFFGQRYFNHRDHREVGWAALDAVAPAAANPHYFPDAGPPHQVGTVYLSGTLEPDVWIDITDTIDAKAEALLHHESQLGDAGEWMRHVVRERAEEAGRAAGVPFAEAFRVLRFID
ncbi:MAG TPA: PIG-L deacetylase family protein [Acidimicrobiales bacterium]|nr:PIG-L deacetylase family protein [Acidimicrobiales bacterium]